MVFIVNDFLFITEASLVC